MVSHFRLCIEPANMRLQETVCQGKVIWQVLIKCDCAPESLQCFGCARKHSKTPRSGFDLSALTAGECHPLGQSSATEKGTYIGNRPRCLPERFENSCEVARLCKSHAIQRSQMLWNGSCVAVQPKTLTPFLTELSNP